MSSQPTEKYRVCVELCTLLSCTWKAAMRMLAAATETKELPLLL